MKIATLITVVSLLVGCNGVIDDEGVFAPSIFIGEIKKANLPCVLLNDDSHPKLINAIPNHKPFGVYEGTDFTFALFNSYDHTAMAELVVPKSIPTAISVDGLKFVNIFLFCIMFIYFVWYRIYMKK